MIFNQTSFILCFFTSTSPFESFIAFCISSKCLFISTIFCYSSKIFFSTTINDPSIFWWILLCYKSTSTMLSTSILYFLLKLFNLFVHFPILLQLLGIPLLLLDFLILYLYCYQKSIKNQFVTSSHSFFTPNIATIVVKDNWDSPTWLGLSISFSTISV
jgi:hypothetical protein